LVPAAAAAVSLMTDGRGTSTGKLQLRPIADAVHIIITIIVITIIIIIITKTTITEKREQTNGTK